MKELHPNLNEEDKDLIEKIWTSPGRMDKKLSS
jgi:hypothetical protein